MAEDSTEESTGNESESSMDLLIETEKKVQFYKERNKQLQDVVEDLASLNEKNQKLREEVAELQTTIGELVKARFRSKEDFFASTYQVELAEELERLQPEEDEVEEGAVEGEEMMNRLAGESADPPADEKSEGEEKSADEKPEGEVAPEVKAETGAEPEVETKVENEAKTEPADGKSE